jgi:hypothetical protein
MEQALEALEAYEDVHGAYSNAEAAITALREALAEPAWEPVGFGHFFSGELIDAVSTGFKSRMEQNNDMSVYDTPLYTAAPPAPAVELTDEEIAECGRDLFWPLDEDATKFARAAIAAHEAKKR